MIRNYAFGLNRNTNKHIMQGGAGVELSSTLSSTYIAFKGKKSTINDGKLIEEVRQHQVLNNNIIPLQST